MLQIQIRIYLSRHPLLLTFTKCMYGLLFKMIPLKGAPKKCTDTNRCKMGNHFCYIACLLGHSCKLAKVQTYTLKLFLLAVKSSHLVQDFPEYINSTRCIPDGCLAPTRSWTDLWLLLLYFHILQFSVRRFFHAFVISLLVIAMQLLFLKVGCCSE